MTGEKRVGRIGYLDVARGLGVLVVVLYHGGLPDPLRSIIRLYALALFFFLAGAVYKESYADAPLRYTWRRIKQLYLPYVAWGLGYLALHNAFLRLNILSNRIVWRGAPLAERLDLAETLTAAFQVLTLRGGEHMAGALWFLPALLIASEVFLLVSWLTAFVPQRLREPARAAAVLAVASIGYADGMLHVLPLQGGRALLAVAVIYLGVLFRRYEPKVRWSWPIALMSAVVLYAGIGTADFGSNRYANPLWFVLVSVAGLYVNLYLARALEGSRLLAYAGRHSILVVATHFLAFKLVSLVIVAVYGLPAFRVAEFPAIEIGQWWIAYFVVGFGAPLAVRAAFDAVKRYRLTPQLAPLAAEETG